MFLKKNITKINTSFFLYFVFLGSEFDLSIAEKKYLQKSTWEHSWVVLQDIHISRPFAPKGNRWSISKTGLHPTPNFWEAFYRRRARFAPCAQLK